MTPEEKTQFDKLVKQNQELLNWKKSLEASFSFPKNVQDAITVRLGGVAVSSSSKSATSENQLVDEGGVAVYSVLKAPDGFLQITVSGTIYYIPIFT